MTEHNLKNTYYGLQLYSLHDITDKDFEGALKAVAGMGYKSVEYAGFFGHSAETVREWQDRYGLVCCGTHSPLKEIMPENIEKSIEYFKTIGCGCVVVPGAEYHSLEDVVELCNVMNRAQLRLAKDNIRLAYHNHSYEFRVMPWGSTIHSELEKRGNFDFQLDTYWLFNAGIDPIQTMERLFGRLESVHLKDGLKGGIGRSLGQGEAPVGDVRRKAAGMGIDIIVESEGTDPTGIDEVRRCMDYLKSQEN